MPWVRPGRVGDGRLAQQVVAPDPGQHRVVDRRPLGDNHQRPPERSDVRLRRGGAVPVVEAAIHAPLVVREPQFRHEPRKAREQDRVQFTLEAEERMQPGAPNPPEAEAHHEGGRRVRRAVTGRLAVHGRGRAVGPRQAPADVIARLVEPFSCDQQQRAAGATRERGEPLDDAEVRPFDRDHGLGHPDHLPVRLPPVSSCRRRGMRVDRPACRRTSAYAAASRVEPAVGLPERPRPAPGD